MNVVGKNESLILFSEGDRGVVVDTSTNAIQAEGLLSSLTASASWDASDTLVDQASYDLASAALTSLDINVFASGSRLYTIPKAAQAEAKRGLEWRKEHNRGGTPVGVNTARTLAEGGQIGIEKVRHIAKYFPRHEIDKKAKGYEPGEDGFPSRGRIAWALWGGDSAWRWARAIVERENKKALKADGYVVDGYEEDDYDYITEPQYDADLDAFKPESSSEIEAVEFIARIRLDGSGIDRLYKISNDGTVCVWDGGHWHSIPGVDPTPIAYDYALDYEDDGVQKDHVEIDPQSALFLSACFQEDPHRPVSLFDIDYEEADMILSAASELDLAFIDRTIVAAGAESTPATPNTDGVYTPEERSKNAVRQVRDKTGKFSKQGSRVVVGGDPKKGTGTVVSLNPDKGTVNVKLETTGNIVEVPANTTEPAETAAPTPAAKNMPPLEEPLDTSGILAQPRTPVDRPYVQLPGTLPKMSQGDVSQALNDWSTFVQTQRNAAVTSDNKTAKPPIVRGEKDVPQTTKPAYLSELEKLTGIKLIADPYKHPVLSKFLNKKVKGSDGKYYYPNKLYYQPIVRASAAKDTPGKSTELTPETSDVQPVFFAVVSPDDLSAVMDLVTLVPASSTSNEPMTYVRKDKKWVRDEGVLVDLNSPTPPPVVPLDAEALKSVIQQVDGEAPVVASANRDRDFITVLWGPNNNIMFLTAAGGADRNRGNAENLRRYWTIGKGGLKIRWGTPGDWTRCYRHLKKYMGPRAKGYCALRHKEMNGMWPGDKRNPGMKNAFAVDDILSSDQIIEASVLSAKAEHARNRVLTAGGEVTESEGAKFTIPMVIPEGIETGDGRKFEAESIEIRDLPLPLMWQIKSDQGHNGSVVIGRIDYMERIEGGIGNARGVFDTGEYGKEAERLVRNGFIRGVSADLDQFEASEAPIDLSEKDEDGKIGTDKLVISHARVMAVTLVPKPAFQECQIYLVDDENQEDTVIQDGIYVDDVDPVEASALVACGVVASSIPVTPPSTWFENPKLNKATPLTVDDEGRVFGHIAAWNVDHIGMHLGVRPPRSRSKYAYFHTGIVRTDDGKDIPVGQLTLAGGHAGLEASAQEAVRHYDDTASAFADVHAGEDAYGIWVAGALRPGTTPEQVRAIRASAPSGDWRPIKGQLELVAVCQVNVPGFPIARARVASGAVMALVAAGASTLARMKSDPMAELAARVQKLEQLENAELSAKAEAVREKFAAVREEQAAALSAQMDAIYERFHGEPKYDDQFSFVSREKRQALAKKGYALPDGSFPIASEEALKDAIHAYGRAKPGKRAAVRRHIMKRARALDKADLIPDEWKSASAMAEDVAELRARAIELSNQVIVVEDGDSLGKALAVEVPAPGAKYVSGKTQPRDAKGKFRQVLARIKQDLGDQGSDEALKKIEQVENLDDAGNYLEAARSAGDLISIVDRLDAGALNKDALENVRASARELGKVIANLPLPFGSDTEKVRFSDLPPTLRGLMEDMIKRVEDKIGQKDADEATVGLKSFMSGGDYFSQQEISSEMSKLLRLLT